METIDITAESAAESTPGILSHLAHLDSQRRVDFIRQQQIEQLDNLPNLGELSKQQIMDLAATRVAELGEYGGDKLRMYALAAKMKLFCESVMAVAKTDDTRTEIEQYKGGLMREGVVLTASSSTTYDYKDDPKWRDLDTVVKQAEADRKEWQQTLQKPPRNSFGDARLDEDSGEVYKPVYATKKTTDTITATIK